MSMNNFGLHSTSDDDLLQFMFLLEDLMMDNLLKFTGQINAIKAKKLQVGVIRVCGTAEFEGNLSRKTEF